jgi:Uncharacterized BCR, YaiI/YqxD family COG1671
MVIRAPVREETYRVAARLRLNVFVVSNGPRPIRPPGMSNVSMILVGDSADAADDRIAERVGATDVCVTSDIPLASRCLKKGGERGSPCLSARADPRRGTDRDELDGYARWATWLGGFLRRSGLYCLYDRSAGARSLGLAARYRREADRLCCRKDRAAVHCSRNSRELAAGQKTYAVAASATRCSTPFTRHRCNI